MLVTSQAPGSSKNKDLFVCSVCSRDGKLFKFPFFLFYNSINKQKQTIMGIRAHRIVEVKYAEQTLFKLGASNLGDFLLHHGDTNDNRNSDGGGQIEFPFRVLKEALKKAEKLKLDEYDIEVLKSEIAACKKAGKASDEFISFDLF